MKCSVKNQDNKIEILIDDTPHLILKRSELIGIQSWIEGEEHKTYYIEFYFQTRDILAEYNEKEKWQSVLKSLDKENLFQDNF